MYCRKCGGKMQYDARFCPECGAAVKDAAGVTITESNIPELVVKPAFVPWAVIVSILPLQAFMTFWGGGFFGGFSLFAVQALGVDLPPGSTIVFFGALFFFAIPFVTYTAQKRTYAETEYRFYRTKLDYREGVFSTESKSIDFRNVTRVNLVKGIIQKRYGLGTIVLSTPAKGGRYGRSRSGIRVHDIPNADRVYEHIRGLIERSAGARAA